MMYLPVIHRKSIEFKKGGEDGGGGTYSHSHLHTDIVLMGGGHSYCTGLSSQGTVEYPLCALLWCDPSKVIVACIPSFPQHVCLRQCADVMYEAVCPGWVKKNGILHHLASHCQTPPRHYTSQKYQEHPRLSNFAICWQCLHGGWFVITNSRAKINRLIHDPSCICTMKTLLVMLNSHNTNTGLDEVAVKTHYNTQSLMLCRWVSNISK